MCVASLKSVTRSCPGCEEHCNPPGSVLLTRAWCYTVHRVFSGISSSVSSTTFKNQCSQREQTHRRNSLATVMFVWQPRTVLPVWDTGKLWERRGRTSGLSNWIIELSLCRFTHSDAAVFSPFFGWGGGGWGGDEGGNNWDWETFLCNSFPDYPAAVGVRVLFVSCFCQTVTWSWPSSPTFRSIIRFWDAYFGGYFPPQPGSDYGGRRHSLWRCVRALRGHWQVSVALLVYFSVFNGWRWSPGLSN